MKGNDLRERLRALGLCPTASGLEMAERDKDNLRELTHESLDYLTPGDLLTVYLIAAGLGHEARAAAERAALAAEVMELAGGDLSAAAVRAAVERRPVGDVAGCLCVPDVVH